MPYRGVSIGIFSDGTRKIVNVEETISHPDGIAVDLGTIYFPYIIPKELENAENSLFCSVTARFRFGIPLYHYGTGVQYKLRGRHPISDIPEGEPYLLAARDFARRQGVSDISSGYYYDSPKEEFYSGGLTMDWNYCEDFDGIGDK